MNAREQREKQAGLLKKRAAVKIQRSWRAWNKHQKENKHKIASGKTAAIKIQARWRAHHVRKTKNDKAASLIQKRVRGFLVRLVMRRHNAAVVIQRHFAGRMVRKNVRALHNAATKLQRVARGKQGREGAQRFRGKKFAAALLVQRLMRGWRARREAAARRALKGSACAKEQAATTLQSFHRGNVGRKAFATYKRQVDGERQEHEAATKLQASVRQRQATRQVEEVRAVRLATLNHAATTIRKHWLGRLHRARFLQLREEFSGHVPSIVTIQRYVRGFLVRVRMWRDAIRAEEQAWGAVEIQRCWRGYLGRLRWEMSYESVWSRQLAAERLQRHLRGWLGRSRVHRLRKRHARAAFEAARRRFKGAQKFQAVVRGHLARLRIARHRDRVLWATTTVQRITRGHQFRSRLWIQVRERRASQIQSCARGFFVRLRRKGIIARVIMVQRTYRRWLATRGSEERAKRVAARRRRVPVQDSAS